MLNSIRIYIYDLPHGFYNDTLKTENFYKLTSFLSHRCILFGTPGF